MAVKYEPQKIEKKWEKKWKQEKLYKAKDVPNKAKKKYVLPQLPYPSGDGLHVGHAEGYTACDIYARYQRMTGYEVMQVIGWDSFGLPAENYAIKTNIHPAVSTDKAIENFRYQLGRMGCSLDWEREVGSHNPDYYKWTQWFFLLMYNQGLVYRDKQMTNWCPNCKTVLANDQVKEGSCERCDAEVEQKAIDVWYIKITDYADQLYEDLSKVDWPAESIKRQQDWIGKSRGAEIIFELKPNVDRAAEAYTLDDINVFTTRPDTIYGATFLVLSPEMVIDNEAILEVSKNKKEIEQYVQQAMQKSSLERSINKEKSGVLLDGIEAINPANGREIPVFVADYVLTDYGTGAVMGVPAHDQRDNEFAQNYGIDVIQVVRPIESAGDVKDEQLYTGHGVMQNSGEYDGMDSKKFAKKIISDLQKKSLARKTVMYRLHDWSVSRQRFWGAPVPMICKALTQEEKELQKKYQQKPDRVINLHAWGSDSRQHYHSWIDEKLKELKISSITPDLPETEAPIFEDWYSVAKGLVEKDYTANSVLTTRSLSSIVALKLAEKFKFRKLVLVAPVYTDKEYINKTSDIVEQSGFKIWKKFVERELDLDKVSQNVGEILFVLSTDDPYIPLQLTEKWIKTNFPFARIMRKRDSGHFDSDHGYSKFPELLDEITRPVSMELIRVKEDDMPVLLPQDVDFMPTGRSPLTYSKKFQEGVEDKYGTGARREVDTLDTFMCSSWYYMRYLDPKNDECFADEEILDAWMPVDFYIGGPEHVTGHLLYSRFFVKVLYDAGYVDFDEPFMYHRHQGLILGEDGRKMSKRWGNVINPTDVMDRHGADTLRLYEMFMGPLEDSKAWNVKGEKGVYRFLCKVWNLHDKISEKQEDLSQRREFDKLIDYIGAAIEDLKFNTCVSKFMEFINFLSKEKKIDRHVWEDFLKIFAPFAPFISEELWSMLGYEESIHLEMWPKGFGTKEQIGEIEIPVQVNGKVRGVVLVSPDADEEEVDKAVQADAGLVKYFDGVNPRGRVYVPGRIISYEL